MSSVITFANSCFVCLFTRWRLRFLTALDAKTDDTGLGLISQTALQPGTRHFTFSNNLFFSYSERASYIPNLIDNSLTQSSFPHKFLSKS